MKQLYLSSLGIPTKPLQLLSLALLLARLAYGFVFSEILLETVYGFYLSCLIRLNQVFKVSRVQVTNDQNNEVECEILFLSFESETGYTSDRRSGRRRWSSLNSHVEA